ncbi:MAG: hypothetical protein KTR25_00505 [Myxococcales bacterium]|nr:hypothetical protein [Myxococcales bacterium]
MYQFTVRILGASVFAFVVCTAADARADDEHKNMKVLEHTGSSFKKSMKALTKGIGVKCTACHVKKKFDSEEKEMKDRTRFFFEEVVGNSDMAQRKASLQKLLKVLGLEAARDEAKLWKGIDSLKKKV